MSRKRSPESQRLFDERNARREARLERKRLKEELKGQKKPRKSRMSPERQQFLAERTARREERLRKKAEKEQAKLIKKSRKKLITDVKIGEKEFKKRKKEASKRVEENGVPPVQQPTMEMSGFDIMHLPVSFLCKVCHQVKKSTEFVEEELCEMCFFKGESNE